MTGQTICDSLSKLFNNSFIQGKVPSQWKQTNVTPIYKKGEQQNITNYGPISLVSVVGKLQERIVYTALYAFLSRNKLLTSRNSGFKPLDYGQDVNITFVIYIESIGSCLASRTHLQIENDWYKWSAPKMANGLPRKQVSTSRHKWNTLSIVDYQCRGTPTVNTGTSAIYCIRKRHSDKCIRRRHNHYASSNRPYPRYNRIEYRFEHLSQWAKEWAVKFSAGKSEQLIVSRNLQRYSPGKPTYPAE